MTGVVTSRAPSLPPVVGTEPEASVTEVERLYKEHHAFVWRNARRLGCADEWVDDAVQEVFLVAARRLRELTPDANLRAWLFAIVFRVVQRMQRDRSRYRARLDRYSVTCSERHAPSAEGSNLAASQLRDLLAQLDDAKRVVVILIELEGMTSAEVARLLGVPAGTVDSRLRAARKQLANLIARARAADEESP